MTNGKKANLAVIAIILGAVILSSQAVLAESYSAQYQGQGQSQSQSQSQAQSASQNVSQSTSVSNSVSNKQKQELDTDVDIKIGTDEHGHDKKKVVTVKKTLPVTGSGTTGLLAILVLAGIAAISAKAVYSRA